MPLRIRDEFFEATPAVPGIGRTGRDRFKGFRRFDSPATSRYLRLHAAEYDLKYAHQWCHALLDLDRVMVLAQLAPTKDIMPRALWDAALVALHKHIGSGADKEIRGLYEEVCASDEKTRVLCEDIRYWRNKRVAHPRGAWESHSLGFLLDEEEKEVIDSGAVETALSVPPRRKIEELHSLIKRFEATINRRRLQVLELVGDDLEKADINWLRSRPEMETFPTPDEQPPGG